MNGQSTKEVKGAIVCDSRMLTKKPLNVFLCLLILLFGFGRSAIQQVEGSQVFTKVQEVPLIIGIVRVAISERLADLQTLPIVLFRRCNVRQGGVPQADVVVTAAGPSVADRKVWMSSHYLATDVETALVSPKRRFRPAHVHLNAGNPIKGAGKFCLNGSVIGVCAGQALSDFKTLFHEESVSALVPIVQVMLANRHSARPSSACTFGSSRRAVRTAHNTGVPIREALCAETACLARAANGSR